MQRAWIPLVLLVLANSVPIARTRAADAIPPFDDKPGSNWASHGYDAAETRFSPLKQIHSGNVDQLKLAWSHELGTRRGLEATPIVIDGTMYLTGTWSVVTALDAKTGTLRWRWDPKVDKSIWGRRACCDVVNRGVAYHDGKIYVGVLDGRLAALDATTGQPVWQTVTFDQTKNYTITGAPRVADGLIVIGNGGAEFGVRGHVSAYDAQTGKQRWRTYTVPGNPENGFENATLREAAKTWTGDWWKAGGGGTCWDSMAYDPELNLLYVGTGNGSPWNRSIRSPGGGDNLYLSSIIALRPQTGELVWHYQTTPGDTWDYTATQHMILADLEIEGQVRKVLMQAPKNGFFYVLDRTNGEFISANNYTDVTWAEGIDPHTGRPIEREGQAYTEQPAKVKPGPEGGHNWQPMAYNPKTRLVYFPVQEFNIGLAQDPNWKYDPVRWNLGVRFISGGIGKPPGSLVAWDPIQQKAAWRVDQDIVWNGGVLTTAGDLVFQGTGNAEFVAYEAKTGRRIWSSFTATGIIAPPVTYEVDGEQFISLLTGWGGSYGLRSAPGEKARKYAQLGRVLTFSLNGQAPKTEFPRAKPKHPTGYEVDLEFTEAEWRKGGELYAANCTQCHSGGGNIPDLAYSSAATHQLWNLIVFDGIYAASKGMPAFNQLLTRDEVKLIQAYTVYRSQKIAEYLNRTQNKP